MTEIQHCDATELARKIRAGELSATESVEHAIGQIRSRNPEINAFVAQRFEEALAEARSGTVRGPLAGVPFGVKDLGAEVAGLVTSRGSRLWKDDVATADSELVRRYRSAGMIPIGMTSTPELGKRASTESALHGVTCNPWDIHRSARGSSGGSAAAVAAGMVPVAHGTDGGGSIRIPAARNGVVGLKPSRGRITSAPHPTMLSNATAVHHVLTRSVRDSALLLEIGAGTLPGDPYGAGGDQQFVEAARGNPGPLRIGLVTELHNGPTTDPECVSAARQMAALCDELGHTIVEISAPWDTAQVQQANGMMMGIALGNQVRDRLEFLGRELREDDLEPHTLRLVEHYRAASSSDICDALETGQRVGWSLGVPWERWTFFSPPSIAR